MRLFVTFHGGKLGNAFTSRGAAERFPGSRMVEAAFKTISEFTSAHWDDAGPFKPEIDAPVLLYRRYDLPSLSKNHPEGFVSYGCWRGDHWYDLLFHCPVDDVKCWHELPPPPLSGTASQQMLDDAKAHLERPE